MASIAAAETFRSLRSFARKDEKTSSSFSYPCALSKKSVRVGLFGSAICALFAKTPGVREHWQQKTKAGGPDDAPASVGSSGITV
jgi:hypothetical protein